MLVNDYLLLGTHVCRNSSESDRNIAFILKNFKIKAIFLKFK